MNITRRAVLGVADQPKVKALFESNEQARKLVSRFVAGETLEDAMAVARELTKEGIFITLDQLGENVNSTEAASAAVVGYVDTLKQLRAAELEPNISVKLTMLGMDLGDELATENMVRILEAAHEVDGFVRIDMEGSDYTERTMRIFTRLHDRFPDNVGIVLQAMLHRTAQDVIDMIERGARVRLVKGAYAEPESVAIQSKKEVDENFRMLMRHLMDKGTYPAIATHDPKLIDDAIEYARKNTIAPDRYEFQMLYGVRTSEHYRLRKAGYNVRVYIPFGTEWYAYYTRRIAERPSNALFVLRQMIDR
jgi:proline dehydrogenase